MLSAPSFLFLDINRRCDMRCKTCLYWTLDERKRAGWLTAQRRREILEEFASLSPGGSVVICGGESLLDPEDYFHVTRSCRDLGLRCISVTNGSRIGDAAAADRLLLEGPHEITVSLNSHLEEVHDRSRGVEGAHRKAVQALRLLIESRSRTASPAKIFAMAIVSEENYRDLPELYEFVLRDLGADKLKLNILQPTFGADPRTFPDRYFADQTVKDAAGLESVLRECDRAFALDLNPKWIRDVLMYVRSVARDPEVLKGWHSPFGTEAHICDSYERNIMVDLYGTARLCFSTKFPGRKWERPGDLGRLWEGSGQVRDRMRTCHAYCGISHSVRRENATLKPGGGEKTTDITVAVISRNQERSLREMLAALRLQVPDLPRLFVLDRTSDGSAAYLTSEGERFVEKRAGWGFEAGAARDFALGHADPAHDVLFFDADRRPARISLPLVREGLRRFDICLFRAEDDGLRDWFAPHFTANPLQGSLNNGLYSCGFSIRRRAIDRIRRHQGGRLFHRAFDGVYGFEDMFLGATAARLGLTCGGYPEEAGVRGSLGGLEEEYKSARFREQRALYRRMFRILAGSLPPGAEGGAS